MRELYRLIPVRTHLQSLNDGHGEPVETDKVQMAPRLGLLEAAIENGGSMGQWVTSSKPLGIQCIIQ